MTWRRRHGGVVLVIVVASLFSWVATAAAETTIEATTPSGTYYPNGGGRVPLVVTLTADGATTGDVVVVVDERPIGSVPVEVPGGSTKVVVVDVPVLPWIGNYSVRYAADDAGDSATTRLNLRPAGADELVGVLPQLASRGLPESADLTIDVGDARLFAVDPTLLEEGSRMLRSFGYVVATSRDVDDLSESQRDALLGWVADHGGTLVVAADVTDASTIAALDGVEFEASDQQRARLGVGQVLFVGDDLGEGFDGVLEPRAIGAVSSEFFGFEGLPTTVQLASDAGIRVPEIDVLVIAILVYAFFAGPVMWVVLRRRRREPLLWVAIPVLAMLATGVVYVTGQAIRGAASTAHATVDIVTPGGRYAATHVLVTSRNGGSAGVRLDDGWQAQPNNPFSGEFFGGPFFDGPFGGPAEVGGARLDGEDLTVTLDPGGFGVVRAEASDLPVGVVPFDLVARYEDDDIVVDVTNNSGVELRQVVVGSATSVRSIPLLEPGESTEVRLADRGLLLFEPDPMMSQLMRGDDAFRPNQGSTNPGVVVEFLSANRHLRRDGFVTAFGWTKELPAPVHTASGATIGQGRTALGAVVRVQGDAGSGPAITVVRGLETGQRTIDRPPAGECAEGSITVRVNAEDVASAEVAVLKIRSQRVAALDVWVGDSWIPARLAELDRDPVIALPAEAVATGETYLRLSPSCNGFGRNDLVPEIRPASPDDVPLPLGVVPGDDEEEEEAA